MRATRFLVPLLASGLFACAGPKGQDGSNGKSCTVAQDPLTGATTISCEDGTHATVTNGAAGSSCTVEQTSPGVKTIHCDDGTEVTVTDGQNGADGAQGPKGLDVRLTNFHGADRLLQEEWDDSGKSYVNAVINSAAIDGTGKVTVQLMVKDKDQNAVLGLKTRGSGDSNGLTASIAKLVLPTGGEVSGKWVSYIYITETAKEPGAAPNDWPNPKDTKAEQAYREDNGTLTDHGDGTYTYVFAHNVSAVTTPVTSTAVPYDAARTHRVAIMMGGHGGPTATATYDFVPAGGAVTEKRELMQTATCQQCHGPEFAGHGGDRLTVENCATCHAPGATDANSGESLDLKVMIHKIHAGQELASIKGEDGKVWDDPATETNESTDNGKYAIWGYRDSKHEWWKAGFPAIIENCEKCHQGSGAQVNNWKTTPSRAVCGSCHDNVSFANDGTRGCSNRYLSAAGDCVAHTAGEQTTDACGACHPATGKPVYGESITNAHDWNSAEKDPRNTPEYDVAFTITGATGGSAPNTYFQNGDVPVVHVVLTPKPTEAVPTPSPIDHTTLATQPPLRSAANTADPLVNAANEGCFGPALLAMPPADWDKTCVDADSYFSVASFFVHGPRSHRNPVLTTRARAQVFSNGFVGTAPNYTWDLSFPANNTSIGLSLKVDGGGDVEGGLGAGVTGTISVSLPAPADAAALAATPQVIRDAAGNTIFANARAATAAEIVNWLNADPRFRQRAIAFVLGARDSKVPADLGKVGIRSRNLGNTYSIQLLKSWVAARMFGLTSEVPVTSGTVATSDTDQIVGTGTSFSIFRDTYSNAIVPNKSPWVGWNLRIGSAVYAIKSVEDATHLTLTAATTGGAATAQKYVVDRYALDTTKFTDGSTVINGGGSNSLLHQRVTTCTGTGCTPSGALDPTKDDPKIDWSAGEVAYTLDPVTDDLKTGTYVTDVEIGNRGRVSNDNYKTPTVGRMTFQVRTATEQKLVAGNCGSCHVGPSGKGFVLDYPRHNKLFNNTALDQCGNCHDYQPSNATGEWSGGHPIAKRVHAVHNGSKLLYPLLTVGYANGDPVAGRNWDITFPQDVRNCEACHDKASTSGSWATRPSRPPCLGCHDSDNARGHIRSMVYDPTPADPWSGDEVEGCSTCH